MALSADGTTLFVADCYNHKIRQVDVATGAVNTLAGSGVAGCADGTRAAAQFNGPRGLALGRGGATLFVADWHNNTIRQVEVATGAVSTLAGTGGEGSAVTTVAKDIDGIAVSCDGAELLVACAKEEGLTTLK